MAKKISITSLKRELSNTKKLANEYLDSLQRLQAEFDNYRKRIISENAEREKLANEKIIMNLLEILDTFDKALKNKNVDLNGIKLIFKQFNLILKNYGLAPITTKDCEFDSKFHEAILTQTSNEKKEGIILEELEKGYLLNDKLLRASKVIVSKTDFNEEKIGEKNE